RKKINDLEQRSRRNNIRIFEGDQPVEFFTKWLLEFLCLKFDLPFEIEGAQHTLNPWPALRDKPRAVVINILRFQQKVAVMRPAATRGKEGLMTWKNKRISIYNNLSRDLIEERKKFNEVRKALNDRGIKHRLLFPANLVFTWKGKKELHADPHKAMKVLSGSDVQSG
ncbi:UNVERIFIED_CONTAM: hypothetical protein FKN15_060234, partial [Acipenser sinensis]